VAGVVSTIPTPTNPDRVAAVVSTIPTPTNPDRVAAKIILADSWPMWQSASNVSNSERVGQ